MRDMIFNAPNKTGTRTRDSFQDNSLITNNQAIKADKEKYENQ